MLAPADPDPDPDADAKMLSKSGIPVIDFDGGTEAEMVRSGAFKCTLLSLVPGAIPR